MSYVTAKVLDCQEMPDDVREAFYKLTEAPNDVWIKWRLDAYNTDPDTLLVDNWVLSQGVKREDFILIQLW